MSHIHVDPFARFGTFNKLALVECPETLKLMATQVVIIFWKFRNIWYRRVLVECEVATVAITYGPWKAEMLQKEQVDVDLLAQDELEPEHQYPTPNQEEEEYLEE